MDKENEKIGTKSTKTSAKVLKFLRDFEYSDKRKQERLVKKLREGGQIELSMLIFALTDTDPHVQKRAAKALGKIGNCDAVASLQKALANDSAYFVRMKAATALGDIGGSLAVEALAKGLKDDTITVRRAAAQALRAIGGPKAATLLDECGDELAGGQDRSNNRDKTSSADGSYRLVVGRYDMAPPLPRLSAQYLHAPIDKFIKDKDIAQLQQSFAEIKNGFCSTKVEAYLPLLIFDAWLYVGNYDQAWNTLRSVEGALGVTHIVNIRSKCKTTTIDGNDLMALWNWATPFAARLNNPLNNTFLDGLTDFGRRHRTQIYNQATQLLEIFHREHGVNLIEYFYKKYSSSLSGDDLSEIEASFFYSSPREFATWKNIWLQSERAQNKKNIYYLFGVLPRYGGLLPVEFETVPMFIEVAMEIEAKRLLRDSENIVRDSFSVPRVGEGWMNEAELLHTLRSAFPDETILHHARPLWLYPQHLDIYLPERNIACEYQGIQHFRSIEYFGGDESFEKQQKRDERKKELCEKEGCRLLYIREGYNVNKLLLLIEQLFNAA